MFSRSLIRFATVAQSSTRLGHLTASITSTFHLPSRPSIIENTRYLSFSDEKPPKGQSLFNKMSMFGDRKMSVDLTHSQERGYQFSGTSSHISLTPEQAKALLAALKDVPEQMNKQHFTLKAAGLTLKKFYKPQEINLRIGIGYKWRDTLVNVDAIPAFTDILQASVDEYNKITSQSRDEPIKFEF